ncbi:MAG: hypothetical protein A2044_01210 [Candidatus Firestonebacteria bacterium GWA2_43_8]|nr:MAG: hypothetical protein A2044_01210 [Candidatus Firestonebacteria bacterium GWA2_43_8]
MAEQKKAFTFLDPKTVTRISNMELRARRVVEGFLSGLHKSPFKGFSVEFADYRQYMNGDDIGLIDWKVFARSDKYYVKEFEEETNLKCFFALDVSGSMGFKSKKEFLSKQEYSYYLVSALAYLMIRQRDSVGLVCFDDKIRTYLPAKVRVTHLRRLFLAMEKTKLGKDTNLGKPIHETAELLKRRGLVVVVTDLWGDIDEFLTGIKHFAYDGHEVIVFHLLDPAELTFPYEEMSRFVDLENGKEVMLDPRIFREKYIKKVNEHLNYAKIELAKVGVDYKVLTTETPVDEALFSYLARRRKLM